MQNALIYDVLNDKVALLNALLNEQGWHNQAKTQVYHCVAKPFRAKCNKQVATTWKYPYLVGEQELLDWITRKSRSYCVERESSYRKTTLRLAQ